ncbi:MAG: TDT family transporter [Cetobacterium sp.]|uniref:TDT family transporter n=1 Tax=Cetobacterium sp. TaxID=2071632 RepID=UPI002FC90594
MREKIKNLPLPVTGLMLGLAATGNLMVGYKNGSREFFGILALIVFILICVKMLLPWEGLKNELENPVTASVFPAFFMGGMILTTYAKPYIGKISFYIWGIFVVAHLIYILFYTKKFILKFNIKKIFPSIFVTYVGIVTASVTAPVYGVQEIGEILFWVGFTGYIIFLPVVLLRVLKLKDIPEPALATIAILTAPAGLCLAGYISTFREKQMEMVVFLFTLATVIYFGVVIMMPKLLKGGFKPSYSSFTFPLVITAIGTKMANTYLLGTQKHFLLETIFKFQEILGIIMTIYVFICYMKLMFSNKKKAELKA